MSYRYLICQTCPALNRVPLEKLSQSPRCGKCKQSLDTEPVLAVNGPALALAIRSCPIPVVVDFWAPWCGPCRGFAPVYRQQAEKEPDRALYLKLNTEDHPAEGSRFHIQGIPTLVAFAKGKEKARQSGALDGQRLQNWISGL